jgi:nucleoside-diphosphate-sugar epimerase
MILSELRILKKVYVTGGSGFVGARLMEMGEKLPGFEFISLTRADGYDLENKSSLDALGESDIVINLAGKVGVEKSWGDPSGTINSNISMTLTVLEYARRVGARVIHLSSYVYGNPKYLPIDEIHTLSSYNPYAASKIQSDELCEFYSGAYSMPVTIIRPFNLYGPTQPDSYIIPNILKQAIKSNTIHVHSKHPRRDYLWIDDLVNAILKVVQRQNVKFSIFNIGAGDSHSASDVVRLMESYTGPLKLISDNKIRQNEVMDCVCDNSLFRSEYDWSPTISLEEGLSRMYQMYKSRC